MKTKNVIHLLLILLILGISACVKKTNQPSSSVIFDTTCNPPCWGNIVPGETTAEEAEALLYNAPWVDEDSILYTTTISLNDSIKWSAKDTIGDSSGRVFFSDNTVTVMNIYMKDKALRNKEIINKLGPPEYTIIFYDADIKPQVVAFMLYPTQGYAFVNYYDAEDRMQELNGVISPDDFVQIVSYCEPGYLFTYLHEGEIAGLPYEFINSNLQKWHDFGQYNLSSIKNDNNE